MEKLKVLDLFSGIGGFSLGLERTGGFETVAFCEIEDYPRKVLTKHWPEVPIYEDVRNVTAKGLAADGIFPSIITGGFPCQDISVAGKQAGIGEGTRSGLWSECARLLGELRPQIKYAIFENVTALLSGDRGRWFQRVLFDLSSLGYDAEWHCISASELGAHHHRDRVWIVAYPSLMQCHVGNINGKNSKPQIPEPRERNCQNAPDTMRPRLQGSQEPRIFSGGREGWVELIARRFRGFPEISEIEPTICGSLNGIPGYAHRLKGLGNAVVPQTPELIGRAILENYA